MDAVEGAGLQASQVMSEARLGISALREDLDSVQVSLLFTFTVTFTLTKFKGNLSPSPILIYVFKINIMKQFA